MKYLIFSDSHGKLHNMETVIRSQSADTAGILFLGDGAADILILRRTFPSIPFYAVLGNCDSFSYSEYGFLEEKLLTLEGKTIYLCHGHTRDVKGGTEVLVKYARRKCADIALYGHTHIPYHEYVSDDTDDPKARSLQVFNPGSISLPRSGNPPSFGVLTIRGDSFLLSHGQFP